VRIPEGVIPQQRPSLPRRGERSRCTSTGDGKSAEESIALGKAQAVCRDWGFKQDGTAGSPAPDTTPDAHAAAAAANKVANRAAHAASLDPAWSRLAEASNTMTLILQSETRFDYLPTAAQTQFRDAYFTAAGECRKAYAAGQTPDARKALEGPGTPRAIRRRADAAQFITRSLLHLHVSAICRTRHYRHPTRKCNQGGRDD